MTLKDIRDAQKDIRDVQRIVIYPDFPFTNETISNSPFTIYRNYDDTPIWITGNIFGKEIYYVLTDISELLLQSLNPYLLQENYQEEKWTFRIQILLRKTKTEKTEISLRIPFKRLTIDNYGTKLHYEITNIFSR